nr:hypothetical protein [uncultured Undibacterium sp.]
MRWKTYLSLLSLCCVSTFALGQDQSKGDATPTTVTGKAIFSFGGLHLNISPAEIKANLPHSYFDAQEQSITVHINQADAKDNVNFAVIFLHNKKPHYALLPIVRHFDKPMPDAFMRKTSNTNPPCEPTLQKLTKLYGKPYGPFDGREEGLLYQDYVWENKTDKMIYSCARYAAEKSKKTFAWLVKFAQNGAGQCRRDSCIDPPR